jgi:hypothetical protein
MTGFYNLQRYYAVHHGRRVAIGCGKFISRVDAHSNALKIMGYFPPTNAALQEAAQPRSGSESGGGEAQPRAFEDPSRIGAKCGLLRRSSGDVTRPAAPA